MKRAGMKYLRAELKWTDEGNEQFENIKKEVIMVTRTGMINYDQPFYVDVAMKKGGLATAVLFQGIIEQARFNLSVGCRMRYLELLEKHNLTVRIIKTKNEANRLLFCDEGEPHCCENEGIRDMKIRPDLKCDLMEGTRTLFEE